jgi:hypothetical protein
MKKVQDLHEAEIVELTKQKKELELEYEDMKHRMAKMDINLTQAQCENKVRFYVYKFRGYYFISQLKAIRYSAIGNEKEIVCKYVEMSKSCFFSQPYPGKKLCTWV